MADWIQAQILRAMLVPADPAAPSGSPGSMRVFHAGRNYFRWRLLIWALINLGALVGILAAYLSLTVALQHAPEWVQTIWKGIEIAGALIFLGSLPFTYMEQKLNFELRWYMVTDRSLRIRSGIWSVQELTTTFANVQEVRVQSGPVQKALGLADVEVYSAGGGTGAKGEADPHVARFEGVDNAPEIRDLIVERLRRYRDSGLGDTSHAPVTGANDDDALAAAQTLLDEVRALRMSLSA